MEAKEKLQIAVRRAPGEFRLRDWGMSRQRYWGCPIPMVHCAKCDVVPVPEKTCPSNCQWTSTSTGRNALRRGCDWKHVTCPKCGGKARRETDTMDTFVDSCWYFARFSDRLARHKSADDAGSDKRPDGRWSGISAASSTQFCTCSIARFFTRAMKKEGYVGVEEPFAGLFTQGMVRTRPTRCAGASSSG